jgi:hypothetical protein
MKSSPARLETAKSGAEYTVRTRCPQRGRKHITVFRLRHVSDSFFVQLGHVFRYAKHFDFLRLRWCTTRINIRTGAALKMRLSIDLAV